MEDHTFASVLWRWEARDAWRFVTVPADLTDAIRLTAGLVDSYALREVGADPSGRTVAGLSAAGGGRTSVPVVVCEYDGTQETGCNRYQVVGEVTTDLAGGATGTWLIGSVTKVG